MGYTDPSDFSNPTGSVANLSDNIAIESTASLGLSQAISIYSSSIAVVLDNSPTAFNVSASETSSGQIFQNSIQYIISKIDENTKRDLENRQKWAVTTGSQKHDKGYKIVSKADALFIENDKYIWMIKGELK